LFFEKENPAMIPNVQIKYIKANEICNND